MINVICVCSLLYIYIYILPLSAGDKFSDHIQKYELQPEYTLLDSSCLAVRYSTPFRTTEDVN